MNGGACTLQFMPYQNGTAVNFHFTIAQVFGARYENYAEDLNKAMQKFLPVIPREIDIDADIFERVENKVTPVSEPVAPAPVSTVTTPVTTTFCANCGSEIAEGNKFCTKCGSAVTPAAPKLCPTCNETVKEGDAFCGKCGTRL